MFLYVIGFSISIVIAVLAGRQLHVLGICGNSGVYSVTPEPTTPTDLGPQCYTSYHLNGVGFTRQSSGLSMRYAHKLIGYYRASLGL